MKKFKILALVMTCAILLSSIMIIPVSAAIGDTYTATNVQGKKITIDGKMDATNEGWGDVLFTLSKHASGPASATAVVSSDKTGNSTARFSYDNEYLYVYYETANADTLADLGGVANTSIYMQLFPKDSDLADTNTNLSYNGESLLLRVLLGNTISNLTETEDNDPNAETYVWEGGNGTANEVLADQFRSRKGAGYEYKKDANAKGSKFYTESQIALRMEYKIVGEGDSAKKEYTKKSVEIRYPLADSYKNALMNEGGTSFEVTLWEKSNRLWNDETDQYENKTTDSNEGYVVDLNSYGWNGGTGYVLNLPSTNLLLDEAKTAPVLVGFQSRTNPNDNSKYDVRFVSVVDDYTGFDLNTSKLGYLFNNGTKDSEAQYCTTVYETLKAGDSTIKATDFGGTYFFCFTITGMDPAETYNWTVKCFTQADAEDAVEYCKNPVTVEITYDSTEKKAVFTY